MSKNSYGKQTEWQLVFPENNICAKNIPSTIFVYPVATIPNFLKISITIHIYPRRNFTAFRFSGQFRNKTNFQKANVHIHTQKHTNTIKTRPSQTPKPATERTRGRYLSRTGAIREHVRETACTRAATSTCEREPREARTYDIYTNRMWKSIPGTRQHSQQSVTRLSRDYRR